MGESKTPISLTKACNRFIHLNLIAEQSEVDDETTAAHTVSSHGRMKQSDSQAENRENVTPIQEIENAILSYINEKGDEPADLCGVGSRLNEKFSDFDVRNYGYSKLRVFVDEEFPQLEVLQKDKQCFVRKKKEVAADKSVIIQEVINMIEKNGGIIDNLSVVHERLKGKHPNFDLKDYGYSRLSSFLRSAKSLTVNGNTVRTRKQKDETERKHL